MAMVPATLVYLDAVMRKMALSGCSFLQIANSIKPGLILFDVLVVRLSFLLTVVRHPDFYAHCVKQCKQYMKLGKCGGKNSNKTFY